MQIPSIEFGIFVAMSLILFETGLNIFLVNKYNNE